MASSRRGKPTRIRICTQCRRASGNPIAETCPSCGGALGASLLQGDAPGEPARAGRARAIRGSRLCYKCACPILDQNTIECPSCGSNDFDDRRTRPEPSGEPPHRPLVGPLAPLAFSDGATMLLTGDAGSGKTTLAMAQPPALTDTTEQEPRKVAALYYRLHGLDAPRPKIHACRDWDDVEEDLELLQEGDLWLVDSVSLLAEPADIARTVKRCIERIRARRARGIFICQYTKDGGFLGPNELKHDVDVVVDIPNDALGMRRIAVKKNRFGGLFSSYFRLGATGILEPPSFPDCYSIEGAAGAYALHLYPMGGAKFAGAFDALAEAGQVIEGMASAAIRSDISPRGFVEPPDVEERKAFATTMGLGWLGPEETMELIMQRSGTPTGDDPGPLPGPEKRGGRKAGSNKKPNTKRTRF